MASMAKVAQILRSHGGWMSGAELTRLMRADGAKLNGAYKAIYRAREEGLIESRGGDRCREYRYVPDPAERVKCARKALSVDEGETVDYVGPVPDPSRGPPVASLGLVCDPEVMPADVAHLIDSIHHRMFRNVE